MTERIRKQLRQFFSVVLAICLFVSGMPMPVIVSASDGRTDIQTFILTSEGIRETVKEADADEGVYVEIFPDVRECDISGASLRIFVDPDEKAEDDIVFLITNKKRKTALTEIMIDDVSTGVIMIPACRDESDSNAESGSDAVSIYASAASRAFAFAEENFRSFIDENGRMNVALITNLSDIVTLEDEGHQYEEDGLWLDINVDSDTCYTGQNLVIDLTFGNTNNDNANALAVRVYVYVTGEGHFNYSVGSHDFDGTTLTISEIESSGEGADKETLYCIEISGEELAPGESKDINLILGYDSYETSGGTVYITGDITDIEEEQKWPENAESVDEIIFTTKAGTPSVSKTVAETAAFTSDENYTIYISELSYTISSAVTDNGLGDGIGKDYITGVTYTDVLLLPDNTEWDENVIGAVENGEWKVTRSSTSNGSAYAYRFYVIVDGTEYTLFTLTSGTTTVLSDYSLTVEDGQIILTWTLNHSDNETEISFSVFTLSYGDNVIRVTDEERLETGAALDFTNTINADVSFNYAEDTFIEDSAVSSIEISEGEVIISKKDSHANANASSGVIASGFPITFTVEAANEQALGCSEFRYLEDALNSYYYFTAEQIQSMFEDDSYTGSLTVTITDASLKGEAITSKEVTVTDGSTATVSDTDTEYSGKAVSDSSLITYSSVIFFCLNDEGNIVMTVSDENSDNAWVGTYTIGTSCDFASVEEALNAIGYIVTSAATYSLVWDLGEDFVLRGGESLSYVYAATAKDSFQLLTSDQDNYRTSSTSTGSMTTNTAKAADSEHGPLDSDSTTASLTRDLTFYKNILSVVRDDETLVNADTLANGDILDYQVQITHTGGAYDAMPLVDKMGSGQYLIVPVSLNEGLEGYGLETVTSEGVEYYILNKAGTYSNVVLSEGVTADTVTVADAETLIYLYVPIEYTTGTKTVNCGYKSIIQTSATEISVENESWLGDEEAHRLYDSTAMSASSLHVQKDIVADVRDEDDPADDSTVKASAISKGEEVTYRLLAESSGEEPFTLTGDMIYDMLPLTVSDYPWMGDNVSVKVVTAEDTEITEGDLDEWNAGWYITGENPNTEDVGTTDSDTQKFICWNSDLSIAYSGSLYIYVTLQFPEGEIWDTYEETYLGETLKNTFSVHDIRDTVEHSIRVTSTASIQKGVYKVGYGSSSVTELSNENSLWYYENPYYTSSPYPIVSYYIAVYNEGPNVLYLDDIQDVLPAGFTQYNYNSNYLYPKYTKDITITGSNGQKAELKRFSLDFTKETLSDERQRLTFSLYNGSSSDDLGYSETYDKYYLEPNEAAVFIFYARVTGYYQDTDDIATNVAAMPFFDYAEGGVEADDFKASWNTTKSYNNGISEVKDAEWVKDNKMDTSGGNELWLTSEVSSYRDNFVPGITKTTGSSVADTTESIEWTLTISNDGPSDIVDYTVTDVMQYPYTFYGDVGFTNTYINNTVLINDTVLFTIGDRTTDGSAEYADITYPTSSSAVETKKLEIDGDALSISTYCTTTYTTSYHTVDLDVSLSTDSNKNEILTIRFNNDGYGKTNIYPGQSIVLRLTTRPDENHHSNTVYYNTAYITPDNAFDQYEVETGSYLSGDDYVNSPSVKSQAQIITTYGYYTLSEKTVTETDDPDNTATSETASVSDTYITLSDKDSEFYYTLEIQNSDSQASGNININKLVAIDNLPQEGDTFTFDGGGSRESAFRVSFAKDPEFTVWTADAETDAVLRRWEADTDYTIEYSEKNTGFTEDDWNGVSSSYWDAALTDNSRSFRIICNSEIGPGEKICVTFKARIDDEKTAPGDIAWNNFGYRYTTSTGATLEASPTKVGVSVPSVPVLIKELTDLEGESVNADETLAFEYLIYKGSETFEWTDEEELTRALSEAGTDTFTKASAEVEAGQSSSEEISLSDLKEYSSSTGEETGDLWAWENGETYTVVELPSDNGYVFSNWNTTTRSNAYTFTYDKHRTTALRNANKIETWTLEITKTDEEGGPLEGAVFSLGKEETAEDPISGTTDSDGRLTFTGLTEGTYILTETQAPSGYKIMEEPIMITVNYDSEAGSYVVTDIQPILTEGYTFEDNVLRLSIENEKDGFPLDIYKYTDENTPLENTGFTFSDGNGGNAVFTYEDDVYTFSEWTEEAGTTLTTEENGFIHLERIPAGTYYLSETKTPDGYVPLSEPVVIIIDENGNVTYDGTQADAVDEIPVVKVYNKRGLRLPETGGTGTFPFAVSGSVFAGTAIFVLCKRKKDTPDKKSGQ